MTEQPYENGLKYRVGALEKRIDKIEDLEPAVLAERISYLSKQVKGLQTAFYTLAASAIVGALLVVITQKGGK